MSEHRIGALALLMVAAAALSGALLAQEGKSTNPSHETTKADI